MEPEFIVAIVAVVLGGGAFIAACLQALLEYLSSSSNKSKCSIAAIGFANKLVKTSWSWSQWKLKVQYPLLNLDSTPILTATWIATAKDDISTEGRLESLAKKNPNRGWRPTTADDRLTAWDVGDHFSVLVTPSAGSPLGVPVKFKDLDWEDTWVFLKYRLRHPLSPVQRPRASWAQMLLALGIRDVKPLFVRLVDGDTVHSNMDTPLQRIKLRTLGQVAFILGFHEVFLDVPNRIFRAYSPIASITTEEVQVLGKVIRFEGDVLELHGLISRCSFSWILGARALIVGQLSFGMYVANGISMPLTTLSTAISRGLKKGEHEDAQRDANIADMRGFSAGPVLREALLLKEIFGDDAEVRAEMELEHTRGATRMQLFARQPQTSSQALVEYIPHETFAKSFLEAWFQDDHEKRTPGSKINVKQCVAKWQATTSSLVPTLYAAASFLSIHGVILAYPSRAVLYPILPWVRMQAKAFYQRHAKENLFKISEELIQSVIKSRLTFARVSSDYLVSRNVGSNDTGMYSWGCRDMKGHFDLIPSQVQQEMIPQPARREVGIVLTKETLELLKDFEVSRWAAEITEKQKASFNMYKALNLIWCQILILDITIQFYIKGDWGFQPINKHDLDDEMDELLERMRNHESISDLLEKFDPFRTDLWGTQEAAVVQSIVKAWRPSNDMSEYVQAPADLAPQTENNAEDGNDDQQHNGQANGSEQVPRRPMDGGETSDHEGLEHPEDTNAGSNNTAEKKFGSNEKFSNGELPGAPVFQEWQLAKHLEGNDKVFPGARTKTTLRKCEFLADMLELRAIFVVALLCLHPDSSDIYLTENEDIEMPMA